MRLLFTFTILAALVGCSSDTSPDNNNNNEQSEIEQQKANIFSKKLVTGFSNGISGVEPYVVERDGTLKQLANINQTGASSSPDFIGTLNGTAYYATYAEDKLSSLWKSDGTAIGTQQVANFILGEGSHVYGNSVINDGVLYFTVIVDNKGTLWKTDGTSSGTYAIETFKYIRKLLLFNNTLYFIVTHEDYTYAIYYSDGTKEGTQKYIDTNDEYIRDMIVFKDKLLYARLNAIYMADGSSTNVEKLFNVYKASAFHAHSEKLFFTTSSRQGLYVSDGTTVGTKKVSNVEMSSRNDNNKLVVDDIFYFVGDTANEGAELWKSDGTVEGTKLVKDLHAGTGDGRPSEFASINGRLYFKITDESNQHRLYSSDGSSSGTKKESQYGGRELIALGNKIFMIGDSPRADLLLLENNVTTKITHNYGTRTNFNVESLIKVGENLLFRNEDIEHGEELWVSDGTVDGTELLFDLNKGDNDAIIYRNYVDVIADVKNFTAVNGSYYFVTVPSEDRGTELWRSDGTIEGTRYVQTLSLRASFYSTPPLIRKNDVLYYNALTENSGDALWRSDGTVSGTYVLKNTNPSINNRGVGRVTPVGDNLFFGSDDGVHGFELFVSDGTENGTHFVKDIQVGANGSQLNWLTDHNGTLFFTANDGVNGNCLYKSDGTENGTVMIKDFFENSTTDPSFEYVKSSGKYLFFIAKTSPSHPRRKLFKSDGTTEGTVVVKTIQFGVYYNTIHALTDVNGTLYFGATGGLWKSDGSADGTVFVKETKGMRSPIAVGNTLFFIATDSEHGRELWKSDGTAEGTTMLKDINPGKNGSSILIRRSFEGKLIFSAFNGTSTKLYMSDGTPDGTKPLN